MMKNKNNLQFKLYLKICTICMIACYISFSFTWFPKGQWGKSLLLFSISVCPYINKHKIAVWRKITDAMNTTADYLIFDLLTLDTYIQICMLSSIKDVFPAMIIISLRQTPGYFRVFVIYYKYVLLISTLFWLKHNIFERFTKRKFNM